MRLNFFTVIHYFGLYPRLIFFFFLTISGFLGLGVWGGYELAYQDFAQNQGSLINEWERYLQVDRQQLKTLAQETTQHLQVLTQHLGRIEANLIRINIVGERLVEFAHLDPKEFNFSEELTLSHSLLGGSVNEKENEKENENFLLSLKEFDGLLERKFAQVNALHTAIQSRLGQRELVLSGSGKPVNGWISSFFGRRSDPFTGHKAWHSGVDIVAKEGAEVKALASGVVSYANKKGGYGSLVEINHGNGLSTRYGHNKKLLVQPGQLVKKGQSIALLGSSGHSTGPHVHLEVHKNGRAVDPGHYFAELKHH